jgi:hypothetical protein
MNDKYTAIQADMSADPSEPFADDPAEDSPPLRIDPARIRRRCVPHRGRVLRFMGAAAVPLAGLSIVFFPLAFVALPLAVITWCLARFDLVRMRVGCMDPNGERLTYEALNDAFGSLVLVAGGAVMWGAIVFWMRL